MPARQAGQLEQIVAVGSRGHLAQAKIEALDKDHVQQLDRVIAWRAGAQVHEGVGEARGLVDVQEKVRDPDLVHEIGGTL